MYLLNSFHNLIDSGFQSFNAVRGMAAFLRIKYLNNWSGGFHKVTDPCSGIPRGLFDSGNGWAIA